MNAKVILVLRIILGLALLVFGLNKFFNFFSMPDMPVEAANFMTALAGTGYMLPVIAIVEIVSGALLLAGFYVPLALLMLVPLFVNILLFHIFLDPSGILPGLVLSIIIVILMIHYYAVYRPLLGAK